MNPARPPSRTRRTSIRGRGPRRVLFSLALTWLVLGGMGAEECNPPPPPPEPVPSTFVNWEIHPVHGLELTTDGTRLLVTNTPAARLEVIDRATGDIEISIPVGLEPVSVRTRSNGDVWVVNHVSDSISIVDLDTGLVRETIETCDEPADVAFTDSPSRAFVTCSRENRVLVYRPDSLGVAPTEVSLWGKEPRSITTVGSTVMVAFFESGNATTSIPMQLVNLPFGPYGGQNPPPNDGASFDPPLAPGLPPGPPASLIVRRIGGQWFDDQGTDWSSIVFWIVPDNDVALLPAAAPNAVTYIGGLMTQDMAITTNGSRVFTVGFEAHNEVRFEPNLNGRFGQSVLGTFDLSAPFGSRKTHDLNPHLDYTTPSVAPALREQSVAQPRAVAWRTDVDRGYVAGFGSSNVVIVDSNANRLGRIEVGAGPVSLALDQGADRLYVLNRFDATVSEIDTDTDTEVRRISLHDPTPSKVRDGRPMLYDAHRTSGTGHVSCASCHIDGRIDQLAWDLGDPSGAVIPRNLDICVSGECVDWHPIKGPLLTQNLFNVEPELPLHWRADRVNMGAFAVTFRDLLGADALPTGPEMQAIAELTFSFKYPPNPFRELDGSFTKNHPNGGDADRGHFLFGSEPPDNPTNCTGCHRNAVGTTPGMVRLPLSESPQNFRPGPLGDIIERVGFQRDRPGQSVKGFGFTHDGTIDTLFNFFGNRFQITVPGEVDRTDFSAFILSFAADTQAAVGKQTTVAGAPPTEQQELVDELVGLADLGAIELIAKTVGGRGQRGYYYDPQTRLFEGDRIAEDDFYSVADLLEKALTGEPVTFTAVPRGTGRRLGIDRDDDGFPDLYEIENGSDPADPGSTPG